MDGKCPYCGAQHYDEVERDLAKLARMQPVVDAALREITKPSSIMSSHFWDAVISYREGE